MKKMGIFILGIVVGSILTIAVYLQFQGNDYATLDKDYHLDNGGHLKKGTKIKYSKGYDEGFEQYILYLNIESGNNFILEKQDEDFVIIPYWIKNF